MLFTDLLKSLFGIERLIAIKNSIETRALSKAKKRRLPKWISAF